MFGSINNPPGTEEDFPRSGDRFGEGAERCD